jgi:hypothetical protein
MEGIGLLLGDVKSRSPASARRATGSGGDRLASLDGGNLDIHQPLRLVAGQWRAIGVSDSAVAVSALRFAAGRVTGSALFGGFDRLVLMSAVSADVTDGSVGRGRHLRVPFRAAIRHRGRLLAASSDMLDINYIGYISGPFE